MNDITLLKEVEQTNVENLILLKQERNIFLAGPVIVFKRQNKPGWPVEYVSANVKNFVGYSSNELYSQKTNYLDIIYDEDKLRVKNEVARFSNGGADRINHKPYRLVKKNGQIVCVSEYTTIIKDESGNITHYLGYVTDVTEQQIVHKALEKNEKRYRAMVESTNAVLWQLDLNTGCFTYMAPQIEKILGFPADTWLDINTWAERIHPEDRQQAESFCTLSTQQGKDHDFEYRAIHSDGHIVWIKDIVTVKTRNGQAEELFGVMIDVTHAKQIEAALRKEKIQYRTLVENIPGVNYRCACDKHWTMELISDEIETLSGYPASDFIRNQKRSYASIIHPEDRKMVKKNILKAAKLKAPFTIEYRILRVDGKIPWVFEKGQAIYDDKGKMTHLDGVIVDISRLKQTETALRKSHKTLKKKVIERTAELENMNAALGVLLKKRDRDKKEMEEKIYTNYKLLIAPFLQKLKNYQTKQDSRNLINHLESSLKEIISPFSKDMSDPVINLAPAEIQIASFVKQGYSNKDIAQTLNKSIRTITTHRNNIRKKLNLNNKKVNLKSFLSKSN